MSNSSPCSVKSSLVDDSERGFLTLGMSSFAMHILFEGFIDDESGPRAVSFLFFVGEDACVSEIGTSDNSVCFI